MRYFDMIPLSDRQPVEKDLVESTLKDAIDTATQDAKTAVVPKEARNASRVLQLAAGVYLTAKRAFNANHRRHSQNCCFQ